MNTSERFHQLRAEYDQKKTGGWSRLVEKKQIDSKLGNLAYADTRPIQQEAAQFFAQAVLAREQE